MQRQEDRMNKENLMVELVENLNKLGIETTRDVINNRNVIVAKMSSEIEASMDEQQIYDTCMKLNISAEKVAAFLLVQMIDKMTEESKKSQEISFETFCSQITDKIRSLPGVHSVKPNELKLKIEILDGTADMIIDIQDVFMKMRSGAPYEAVERLVISQVEETVKKTAVVIKVKAVDQIIRNKEKMCERIQYIPFKRGMINDEVNQLIHKIRLFDLVFYPCIDIKCNIDRYISEGTVFIGNKELEQCNITYDSLYNMAMENAKNIHVNYSDAASMNRKDELSTPIFDSIREDNIAKTNRCLSIFSKERILPKLLYKPFFDTIGASFQEPYYLIMNNDHLFTAYPASEISLKEIEDKLAAYRNEKQWDLSCEDILFYYENGSIRTYCGGA